MLQVEPELIILIRGRLSENENAAMAALLQEAKIKVKTTRDCTAEVKRLLKFNEDSMICGYESNTDACQVSLQVNGTKPQIHISAFRAILAARFSSSQRLIDMRCSELSPLAMVADERSRESTDECLNQIL